MHHENVGRTESERADLGLGTAPEFWSKTTRKERKDLVVAEVVRTEEEQHKIIALSQLQQARWVIWEGVVDRTIKWTDVEDNSSQVKLPYSYHLRHSPQPQQPEENCQFCNAPNLSLHILSSSKTAGSVQVVS